MSYRNPTTYQAIQYVGRYLINGLNQTEAFRYAFPESKATPKTIHEAASRFHKLPKVQYHIRRFRLRMG